MRRHFCKRFETARSEGRFPILSALLTETSDKNLEKFFQSGWAHMALPPREFSARRPWALSSWEGDLEAYRGDLYAGMAFGMHALLSDAGEEAPYVLVGHSFGGANVQLYASEYPEEVAGMVLVDSALDTRVLDKDLRTVNAPPSPLLIKATAPLGILRLLASGEDSLPKRIAQHRSAIYNGTRHLYAVADESATVQKSVAQATDAAPSLGEKPLVALSAGARQFPGLTNKQEKRTDEQMNDFEARLINLSENSELVVANNSEHYIQFDRPVLVVDSIRHVVDAARDGGRV